MVDKWNEIEVKYRSKRQRKDKMESAQMTEAEGR